MNPVLAMIARVLRGAGTLCVVGTAAAIVVFGGVMKDQVSAQAVGAFGRPIGNSYYGNKAQSKAQSMFQSGIPNGPTSDVNTFVSTIKAYLADDANTQYTASHAAVLINTMMGLNGADPIYDSPASNQRWQNGITVARSNVVKWEALVRSYNGGTVPGATVNWNETVFFPAGTYEAYGEGDSSKSTYGPDVAVFSQPAVTASVITFYHPDGTKYTIRKSFGTLIGVESPFPAALVNPPIPPPAPTPPIPPPVPVVTKKPYFQVTGGDVVTGASIATDTVPCSGAAPAQHITTAGIVSWNDTAGSFSGAGASYAVRAWNYIQEFAGGQGKGGTPDSLSFSNQDSGGSVNAAAGYFGGLFKTAGCVDYWGTRPAASAMTDFSGAAAGSVVGDQSHTGDLTLTGGMIGAYTRSTLYVDGNVAITGDITYDSAAWTDRIAIPSFRLIVHGSIFIDPAVTQLDGVYVAVPDDDYASSSSSAKRDFTSAASKPGTITTCSQGVGGSFKSYDPDDSLSSSIQSACSAPLTFNGSVVAHQIWLLRARGNLADAVPAEVFNYPVDSWLSDRYDGDVRYDAISNLPSGI